MKQVEALGDANEAEDLSVVDLECRDLITIVYTSGTSGGKPKGVMLPDSWFNRLVDAVLKTFRFISRVFR